MIGFGQNVNIPDANFKAYLVGNSFINTNGDSEIQVSEAAAFNGSIFCYNLNISDLSGVESFTDLTNLTCSNNQLTSIDLSYNTALTSLNCGNNQLTNLDVSNNLALTIFNCEGNQLTNLDVTSNTSLIELKIDSNQLTSLDVSNNLALTFFNCGGNQLTSLDVSQNLALTELFCYSNQLTSLNLSGASNLEWVACHFNQLTSLDGSTNTALNRLDVSNNQLIALDIRNGNNTNIGTGFWQGFISSGNNNLTCINVDDDAWSTANWTNIDAQHYFSTNCPPPSTIQEQTTNKELLKVTDLLGRETKQTNQPLFYIYDDGTVEKRIVIEQ